ncbi:MAG: hypothetical protein ABFD83_04265 [Armatimonadota bacterium]
MFSALSRRRWAVPLVCIILMALCSPCRSSTPNYCIDKVASTPDLPQCDPEAGFWQDGELFCGPAAVSNSLMWLAKNGFDRLNPQLENEQKSQVAMVKILASRDMMDTTEDGTVADGILRGVENYITKAGYHCKKLEYRGWRKLYGQYKSSGDIPDMKWMQSMISDPAGALWLNIGFYKYDKQTSTYERLGGHWVTVVGYGMNAKGKRDPSILIVHDPSPRSGQKLTHDYCHVIEINDGTTLTGDSDGLPRSSDGYYMFKDGLHPWRISDRAIIDCAVGLVIDRNLHGGTSKPMKWWENKFVLSTFASFQHGDNIEKIVSLLHEAGLNAIETNCPLEYGAEDPTREEMVRALRVCEQHDMRLFVTDHARMTGVENASEDAIKSLADDYSSYPALGGYYVWDEPSTQKFDDVKRTYNILLKLDPDRLPLNAIIPSYGHYKYPTAYPEHVREFVGKVNPPVLSFDFYSVHQAKDYLRVNQDLYRDLALWSSLSLETGKPLWMYVTSCRWSDIAGPTSASLSFQVYTALAYGVKGIQYFESRGFTGGDVDFVDAPVNGDGTKGPSFDLFKSFNARLNAIAPTVCKLKLVKVVHTAPVPPDNEGLENGLWGIKSASDDLIVSFHCGTGAERYLIVVNKDINSARDVYLEFDSDTSLTRLPDMTRIASHNGRISFNMAAGEGMVFKLM